MSIRSGRGPSGTLSLRPSRRTREQANQRGVTAQLTAYSDETGVGDMSDIGLTPLERVRRTIRGETVDRIPVLPILHYGTARLIGATIKQFGTDPEVMARSLIAAQRRFGYDGLQVSLSVAIEAEALGSLTVQPEDAVPYVVHPFVQSWADLSRLQLPNPHEDGRLPVFLDAVHRLSRDVGEKLYLLATIRGPLNMASQLRGVEQLMLDITDSPEFVHELMAFCVEVGVEFGTALARAGAQAIAIGEALCSPSFISPRTYRAFALQPHRDLIARLKANGVETTFLHICGDIRSILPDLATTGVDVVDIDWQVDPNEANELSRGKLALRGNLDPSAILLQSTPDEVRTAARSVSDRAANARFILSSGCDIAPTTPPENIVALTEAVRSE